MTANALRETEADRVSIGQAPENRQQAVVKLLWIGIWLAYLGAPVSDLVHDNHTLFADIVGWTGLVVFVGCYLVLVFRNTSKAMIAREILGPLVVLVALALVLSLTLGAAWLVLFVYVAVGCGAVLPGRLARWAVLGTVLLLLAVGSITEAARDFLPALLVPALLGGFAMIGVRQLVRTTAELRQARATVAQLAANEERLRLARDLHDLLGHSLSLITLKSELAGRMLPDHPDKAAREVADIERVSRQALVDVREAVTGYRRPTLPGELAGARTALTAAGVAARLPADVDADHGLDAEGEAALAWALREAVTNVVRHSGADRCTVALTRRETLDGPVLELAVEDDGQGGGGSTYGNGLTGLSERLSDVGGTLDARPGKLGGFALVARVPLPSTP
ncbi:sensor histidine kinase [Yinghuangia seranimata]|uniref:sensor histidine kinase n=1 Tax=Yinghuangia seranimata TaxID=408067 RepID=UPI00248B809C|nr:histidine kinase [Yinghuangia seranimata]MDI2126597.1 histidine kinase [Yinghuangia seranimata]